jgi:hypothetical protein
LAKAAEALTGPAKGFAGLTPLLKVGPYRLPGEAVGYTRSEPVRGILSRLKLSNN